MAGPRLIGPAGLKGASFTKNASEAHAFRTLRDAACSAAALRRAADRCAAHAPRAARSLVVGVGEDVLDALLVLEDLLRSPRHRRVDGGLAPLLDPDRKQHVVRVLGPDLPAAGRRVSSRGGTHAARETTRDHTRPHQPPARAGWRWAGAGCGARMDLEHLAAAGARVGEVAAADDEDREEAYGVRDAACPISTG